MNLKDLIRQYWNEEPCGTREINYPLGSLAYYEAIEQKRNRLDWYIPEYAQFDRWSGKKILEVGCGAGSDLIRFAKANACVNGLDLSSMSVWLAKERLYIYKCEGTVMEGDAENIPYKDSTFDLVYSWGCLHHTVNVEKAISEIYRVTKQNGEICVMLYHKRSIVALQMWLLYGLLKMKPLRSIDDILANHHESIGTKAYTIKEVCQMFGMFQNLRIDTHITSYDLRYGRDRYLPILISHIIPRCLGWNIIVQGNKP